MFEYKRRYVKCVVAYSHPNIQIKELSQYGGVSQDTNYGELSVRNLKERIELEKVKQSALHHKYIK